MSEDATTANREAVVAAVIAGLQGAFGQRAIKVAEQQAAAAAGEPLAPYYDPDEASRGPRPSMMTAINSSIRPSAVTSLTRQSRG